MLWTPLNQPFEPAVPFAPEEVVGVAAAADATAAAPDLVSDVASSDVASVDSFDTLAAVFFVVVAVVVAVVFVAVFAAVFVILPSLPSSPCRLALRKSSAVLWTGPPGVEADAEADAEADVGAEIRFCASPPALPPLPRRLGAGDAEVEAASLSATALEIVLVPGVLLAPELLPELPRAPTPAGTWVVARIRTHMNARPSSRRSAVTPHSARASMARHRCESDLQNSVSSDSLY
jgi:hypothetical protein